MYDFVFPAHHTVKNVSVVFDANLASYLQRIQDSIAVAKKELRKYFDFYNKQRYHQGLDNRIPEEVYWTTLPLKIVA